jgi:putative transposase
LTLLRRDPRFATIAVDIERAPLRRVDRAFQAFFRRVKAGQKPGTQWFKWRDRYDSFAWHAPKLWCERFARFPTSRKIRFQASRILTGQLKIATVIRCSDKWKGEDPSVTLGQHRKSEPL